MMCYIVVVFEILLEFSSTKDWEKAFFNVIPPRKVVGCPSKAVGQEHEEAAGVLSPTSTSSLSFSIPSHCDHKPAGEQSQVVISGSSSTKKEFEC